MNQQQTVFSQIVQFISCDDFYTCVRRYDGNKGSRRLSCWEQFLAMAFAQLTYRESLRPTLDMILYTSINVEI